MNAAFALFAMTAPSRLIRVDFENGATPGPEVQRVLLEREGVRFTNGRADPTKQVPALMLLARAVQAGLLTLKQMQDRIASQAEWCNSGVE